MEVFQAVKVALFRSGGSAAKCRGVVDGISSIAKLSRFSGENLIRPQVKLEDSDDDVTYKIVEHTLKRGIDFFSTLQAHDGHWPGDYAGPMFLLPGLTEVGVSILTASTMFMSVLNYVTLRLLGQGPDAGDGAMEKGRGWILNHGGATHITSWGKLWLSVLGAYEWSGNNPLPPEIWLLPYFLPVHPGAHDNFMKAVVSLSDGLSAPLIFVWQKEDLYYPHPLVQDILWASLHKVVEPVLTRWPGSILREKALKPHWNIFITKMRIQEDPNSEAFKLHLPRIHDYLWLAEDGMKMQVLEDCPEDLSYWYRHISKGAWPFSTADHGWPISDCTAEGLKATLLLSKFPKEIVGEPVDTNRLYDAVNVLISLQDWISEPVPHINPDRKKRLSIFSPAEQKIVNQARTMRALPDLSILLAGKLNPKDCTSEGKGGSPSKGGPSRQGGSSGPLVVAPEPTNKDRDGSSPRGDADGSKKRKNKKKKELRVSPQEDSEEESVEALVRRKRKRSEVDLEQPPEGMTPAEGVAKKKRKKTKKKEVVIPRSSSVEEGELRDLAPHSGMMGQNEDGDDDENQTVASRIRSRERGAAEEASRRALESAPEVATDIISPLPEARNELLLEESPSRVPEDREARVSGRLGGTRDDNISFEFDRELPLACYPDECARLVHLIKGGPEDLPPVRDLVFKEAYEHAACSSVKVGFSPLHPFMRVYIYIIIFISDSSHFFFPCCVCAGPRGLEHTCRTIQQGVKKGLCSDC
ncbi:hypothetical protein Bca4012_084277 [Brassica carinata]